MTYSRESARRRVRAHRQRLRSQGLRPVQIWVPDVRTPEFAAEARRQSELAAIGAHAADDQQFVDALQAEVWEHVAISEFGRDAR